MLWVEQEGPKAYGIVLTVYGSSQPMAGHMYSIFFDGRCSIRMPTQICVSRQMKMINRPTS